MTLTCWHSCLPTKPLSWGWLRERKALLIPILNCSSSRHLAFVRPICRVKQHHNITSTTAKKAQPQHLAGLAVWSKAASRSKFLSCMTGCCYDLSCWQLAMVGRKRRPTCAHCGHLTPYNYLSHTFRTYLLNPRMCPHGGPRLCILQAASKACSSSSSSCSKGMCVAVTSGVTAVKRSVILHLEQIEGEKHSMCASSLQGVRCCEKILKTEWYIYFNLGEKIFAFISDESKGIVW